MRLSAEGMRPIKIEQKHHVGRHRARVADLVLEDDLDAMDDSENGASARKLYVNLSAPQKWNIATLHLFLRCSHFLWATKAESKEGGRAISGSEESTIRPSRIPRRMSSLGNWILGRLTI